MSLKDTERVIILVDMDCFYCQVEEVLNPSLKGKPIAVVQYNQWQGGGIIAVNYPARDRGVTRHMRGKEAKEMCPEIKLVQVPVNRGKADISKYRDAGKRVAAVLLKFTPLLERASVDEAYLDITEQVEERIKQSTAELTNAFLKTSHVVGFESVNNFLHEVYHSELDNDCHLKLAMGGAIAEEIRAAVYAETSYRCSAGIAHNKVLAKLVCGLHKPNQQTILLQESVPTLYEKMPVKKVNSFGGKFGSTVVDILNVEFMSDIAKLTEKELNQKFDAKTSHWLYQISHGIDHTPVSTRLLGKSIGSCKKFPGPGALTQLAPLTRWLGDLAAELHGRLTADQLENGRRARQLVVSVNHVPEGGRNEVAVSRSVAITCGWTAERMAVEALAVMRRCGVVVGIEGGFCVRFIGLSAGKFEDIKNQGNIASFFKSSDSNKTNIGITINETSNLESSGYKAPLEESEGPINKTLDKTDSKSPKQTNCKEYSQSFFHKLFETLKQKNDENKNPSNIINTTSEITVQDTSNNTENITLNESNIITEESDTEHFHNNIAVQKELFPKFDIVQNSSNVNELKSTCSDCNRSIPIDEVQSHMDYHFALKMVRNESHLYRDNSDASSTCSSTTKKENLTVPKKKTAKRKSPDVARCNKIKEFLTVKPSNVDAGPTEICNECGKTISLEDMPVHIDYHIAKKMHSELNDGENRIRNEIPAANKSKKQKVDNKKSSVRSVSSFFKPVN